MNCRQTRESLVSLLYGELSEKERSEAEAHLASCESCMRDKSDMEKTVTLLAAADDIDSPIDIGSLRREVMARQLASARPAQGAWLRRIGLASAAAAGLVLILSLLNLRLKVDDGVVTISLSLHSEGRSSEDASKIPDRMIEAQRRIAREEVRARMAPIIYQLQEWASEFEERQNRNMLILAGAVDARADSNLEFFQSKLERLERDAATGIAMTNLAVNELAAVLERGTGSETESVSD